MDMQEFKCLLFQLIVVYYNITTCSTFLPTIIVKRKTRGNPDDDLIKI